MTIWKIGIGTEWATYDELKQRCVVAQGWSDSRDLSFLTDKTENIERFLPFFEVDGGRGRNAFQCIFRKIVTGDIVLAFEGNTLKGLCEMPNDYVYYYEDDDDIEYRNCLFPVKWVDWDDFCEDENLKSYSQGGRGTPGIVQSGLPDINSYIKQHWGQFKEKKSINIQPVEQSEKLEMLKIALPNKIKESRERYYNLLNKKEQMASLEQTIDLLKANKNIIFTGAPGTGKTYLAKQIALQMICNKSKEDELLEEEEKFFKEHFAFVQFHPSYDYTDFVEGLRAEDLNGQVIFNLHNGIFKSFCKRAVTAITQNNESNFDEKYDQFINDLSEEDVSFETPFHKKKFKIEINSNKSCVAIPATEVGTRLSLTKEMIRDYVEKEIVRDWKPYLTAVGNYFKEKYPLNQITKVHNTLPYVFVIDEINRGEISKIFGELFFSIDPGYRGEKGKVQTQYANIQSDNTIFDIEIGQGWFYVPENVYIIGTMNDIDRSVESFDFAMRRRFAWMEITSEKSAENMDLPQKSIEKMKSLNDAISKIEGLNTSYHIGAAYFLKLKGDNYQELWDYHLNSLLFEYLRGMPDAESKLANLKKAYENDGQ